MLGRKSTVVDLSGVGGVDDAHLGAVHNGALLEQRTILIVLQEKPDLELAEKCSEHLRVVIMCRFANDVGVLGGIRRFAVGHAEPRG